MSRTAVQQVRALFARSVLKQQKWQAIDRMLGPTAGLRCLDIGADNGAISLLLRDRGGDWTSADLDEPTVQAIRALVGDPVVRWELPRSAFADGAFDRVVLVDGLEHVRDDAAFARELARVTAPGGEVLVNVPLRKESWLRRLRVALGQTDAAHGHVRHGYTVAELAAVLGPSLQIKTHTTYSRFFSQLVDTVITWGVRSLKGPRSADEVKGTVVTAEDLGRHRNLFLLYAALYPFVWTISQLDHLLWFRSGYTLLVKARVRTAKGAP